jgi:hypothetical protein
MTVPVRDVDEITDEYIAMNPFLYFQEHVENLLTAFYASFTNDSLRKMVKERLLGSFCF